MTTYNERVTSRVVASTQSDYTKPEWDTTEREFTNTAQHVKTGEPKLTTTNYEILGINEWTAVKTLKIVNKSASAIFYGYDSVAYGATVDGAIAPGGEMLITGEDIDVTARIVVGMFAGTGEAYFYISGDSA